MESASTQTDAASLQPRHEVLIVEDNPGIAQALAGVLQRSGYGTTICHSGQAAADQVVQQAVTFSAVLVDIHLPDIHGLAVCSLLRNALGPDVPIVVISGDTSMANLNALPHVGATYFFSKPVNPTTLVQRLKEWIALSSKTAQS